MTTMTMIELDQELERLRSGFVFDAEPVRDLYRALLTRVEAAEAEVVDLHRQLAEMAAAMEEIEDERLALLARVAELEAASDAQGWRPVTDDWPPYEESTPVRMRTGVIRWGYRRGDRWSLTGGQYARESVTHAYALPPAPQGTTP